MVKCWLESAWCGARWLLCENATPEEKDEMEHDVTSVQTEARVAVAGRKSGHFEGHQNNNKGAYAALHESGEQSWQLFKEQFEQRAIVNEWNSEVQLIRCLPEERFTKIESLLKKKKTVTYEAVIERLDECEEGGSGVMADGSRERVNIGALQQSRPQRNPGRWATGTE